MKNEYERKLRDFLREKHVDFDGKSVILAYQLIPSLGWYYVEKADLDYLLDSFSRR